LKLEQIKNMDFIGLGQSSSLIKFVYLTFPLMLAKSKKWNDPEA
jgi:hypothetical protein